MPAMRLALGLLLVALLAPAAARAADTPTARTLYDNGPAGRYLMEGAWLFRLDPADRGVRRRYYRETGTAGWGTIQVPHAWNVGDDSVASMNGSVGWYRKDFELPGCRAEPACAEVIRTRVAELRRAGRVEILNYEPSVQVVLTRRTGVGRVAWRAGDSQPVVQCVRVRRDGPLTGGDVELLSISAPIGAEENCP